MEKTYTSGIKLLEDSWKNFTTEQKEELLAVDGFDSSWAKTKTIKEMVRRGGGMVAKRLLYIENEYIKRNGGSVTINWN
jgi:hypothetical protein